MIIFLQSKYFLNPVSNKFSNPLAIATSHPGSNVNGEAFLRLKNLFQVGYQTIKLYTTRVIKMAITNLIARKSELIDRNVNFNYHLANSQLRIKHAVDILKVLFSTLYEMRTQIRNHKEMKVTINWVISCIVLHIILEHLKDLWNELYEEDDPDSAPVVDNMDNSNDGIHGILHCKKKNTCSTACKASWDFLHVNCRQLSKSFFQCYTQSLLPILKNLSEFYHI
ncbi:hypothetical protein VP01_1769g4 [Puccinia sorghi]|uniref:DDE Tnp4 domain-containing protein n=1 Tax=Puccinia sorghi TaxID=27349 RepID=A0A0L6VEX6_9BASI|nr:hypothetical protein VP01_1769g4 [Puccinia sorghi]